jgi:hypothetical protein
MKKIAIGLVAASALFAAAPAMAQVGFYVGPGGIGVGVPGPYYDGCGYYGCRHYYDYSGGPGVVIGAPGWHRGWHHEYRHRW